MSEETNAIVASNLTVAYFQLFNYIGEHHENTGYSSTISIIKSILDSQIRDLIPNQDAPNKKEKLEELIINVYHNFIALL